MPLFRLWPPFIYTNFVYNEHMTNFNSPATLLRLAIILTSIALSACATAPGNIRAAATEAIDSAYIKYQVVAHTTIYSWSGSIDGTPFSFSGSTFDGENANFSLTEPRAILSLDDGSRILLKVICQNSPAPCSYATATVLRVHEAPDYTLSPNPLGYKVISEQNFPLTLKQSAHAHFAAPIGKISGQAHDLDIRIGLFLK